MRSTRGDSRRTCLDWDRVVNRTRIRIVLVIVQTSQLSSPPVGSAESQATRYRGLPTRPPATTHELATAATDSVASGWDRRQLHMRLQDPGQTSQHRIDARALAHPSRAAAALGPTSATRPAGNTLLSCPARTPPCTAHSRLQFTRTRSTSSRWNKTNN